MEQVFPNLYVGGDTDYEKVKDKSGWFYIRCCKYGLGGHQDTLQYHTLGAPKGTDYYFVYRKNRLALNLLDSDDPNFIPDVILKEAIKCIGEQLSKDKKVLVACNQGRSRGPTIAMLYLRSIHDLPDRYQSGFKIFKGIYHKYDPGQGMEFKAKQLYSTLG